ncbi:MAG: ABC transporter permease [Clostridia bacterium]|nr:ABC transporter permease [Clostridia bacterium]
MKKSWFSLRLYADGLKQLRLMGILFTIASVLVAIVPPVMHYLDFLSYYNPDNTYTPEAVACFEMNPLIILQFCVFAPLMTLYLFSFLNKRENSDFYHAIPATRQCLFFSLWASVATWLLGILVISNIAATIAYAAFPKLFLINYSSLFLTGFNCFAGGLLITACVAIAMSVTGTVFTNLLVALILIFFPRVLISLVVMSVESAFPLVSSVDFVPILSAEYNVPVGFIYGVYSGEINAPLTQWQSGVYTLMLALIYTALAALLFVRRRSEAAGHSAPSRALQGLYRFLIGFIVSSIATLGVFTMICEGDGVDPVDWATVLLFYGLAVLLLLVFEVLTTRKFRGLLKKGLRTTMWLIVANVVLFGGMFGLSRSLFLYTPEADEIRSVRFLNGFSGDTYFRSSRQEYFASQLAKVSFDDPVIKKVVSDQLQYTVDLLEISPERYYRDGGDAHHVTVAIDSGWITRYRTIYLYTKDVQQITDAAHSVDGYRSLYTALPPSVSDIYSEDSKHSHFYFETQQERAELYDVIRQEYAALDPLTRRSLVTGVLGMYGDREPLMTLYVRFSENAQWYYFRLPLYPSLMPRTTEHIVNLCNKSSNAASGLRVLAQEWEDIFQLELQYFDKDGASQYYAIDLTKDTELRAQVGAWLKSLHAANATAEVDTDRRFYYVAGAINRIETDGDYKYNYTETNYGFVSDPAEEMPAWLTTYLETVGKTDDDSFKYYD